MSTLLQERSAEDRSRRRPIHVRRGRDALSRLHQQCCHWWDWTLFLIHFRRYLLDLFLCIAYNLRYRLRSTFSCYREALFLCPTPITRQWKSGAWEEARKRQKSGAKSSHATLHFANVCWCNCDAYEIINFKRAFEKSGATKLARSLWRWLIMTFNARKSRGFIETSLSSSQSNYKVRSRCANWKIALLSCLSRCKNKRRW